MLHKRGNRLVIEKAGKVLQWIHAFDVEQVVLLGNIHLSTQVVAHLLKEGIDTVFLSASGGYRGRLVAHLWKNIDLRRLQFRKMEDQALTLDLAKRYVAGKLQNCRVLLRRHNRELQDQEIENCTHRIRGLIARIPQVSDHDTLRGFEGKSTNWYFQGFARCLRAAGFAFEKRTRRPPRDPVNALLSFGYTLLANTIHTAVNITGLDPYLGSLHAVEYGRPSLVLDLMEEFRPVLVDAVVLRVINRRIIALRDFHFQEGVTVPPDGEEREDLREDDYPVLLTHEGRKKWILQYESQLGQRVFYQGMGVQLPYRSICLEQVRRLVRHLKGEEEYVSFEMR